mmetsp:Transcript_965/g.2765  ORF Transcript_965/g.2765 Transcript_965/m.2765 type:complete len:462 (-) Transcript_965:165-1550(-)
MPTCALANVKLTMTDNRGGETPETRTPPRSASASSDGGTSLRTAAVSAPRADFGQRRRKGRRAPRGPQGKQAARVTESKDSVEMDGGQPLEAKTEEDEAVLPVAEPPSPEISPPGFPQLQHLEPPPPEAAVSEKDRRIVEALAAPGSVHRKLLQAARQVPQLILDADRELAISVELYGSLSLDMMEPEAKESREWQQDWASYYVNKSSDIDFVVALRQGVSPSLVLERLLAGGHWKLSGETQVHKFATTQYTLIGVFEDENGCSSEVCLDVTCISRAVHFDRFRKRQEAFRKVFSGARSRMANQFGEQGALAFDAYIQLLKAFAAKVSGNALTGFQATCIGLFTLQTFHFRLKPTQSMAMSLFEGFLRFCAIFYSEAPYGPTVYSLAANYQRCAIDLSSGGRWSRRTEHSWRSELYFVAAEEELRTQPDERMNVVHSLDPARVAAEAQSLLCSAFGGLNLN